MSRDRQLRSQLDSGREHPPELDTVMVESMYRD
eukprot:gene26094-biopygen13838